MLISFNFPERQHKEIFQQASLILKKSGIWHRDCGIEDPRDEKKEEEWPHVSLVFPDELNDTEKKEVADFLRNKKPTFTPQKIEIFEGRTTPYHYLVVILDKPKLYQYVAGTLARKFGLQVKNHTPHASILKFKKEDLDEVAMLLPKIQEVTKKHMYPFTSTHTMIWDEHKVTDVSESLKRLKPLFYEDLEDWSGAFVRYTDFEQPFIAKQQWHQDPAGIYFFPVEYKTSGSWHLRHKYKLFANLKPGARVLDIGKLSKEDMVDIYKKLDLDPEILDRKEHGSLQEQFWRGMVWGKYLGKQTKLSNDLRKLGYDAVFDDTGAIHNAEVQLIILNPAVMKVQDLQKTERGTQVIAELSKRVKDAFSDWESTEGRYQRSGYSKKGTPKLKYTLSKGDMEISVEITHSDMSSREASPNNAWAVLYANKAGDIYEKNSKFEGNIDSHRDYFSFDKKLKEFADKVNAQVEEKVTEDGEGDEDQIGSGDYAISTDKTGKFWGNAGAGGVFYAEDTGRYLLSYRSAYVNEPHTWGVWGGKLDEGETPEQAIRREIEEEAGYKGKYQLKLLHVFRKGDFTFHDYLIIVPKEFKPKLDWETEDYGWFKKSKFPTPLHFGLKDLLPKLENKNESISEDNFPKSITKNPDKKGIIHLIKNSISNAIRILMDKKTGNIWVWAEEEGMHSNIAPLIGVDIGDAIKGQISVEKGTIRGAITSMFPAKSDIMSFIKAFPYIKSLIDLKGTVYFDKAIE